MSRRPDEAWITGVGPVSAIGSGVDSFWAALQAGRSGTKRFVRPDGLRRGCSVAAVVEDPPAVAIDPLRPVPRGVQLAVHAARLAMADARWRGDRARLGVVVGTGLGNLDVIDAASKALAAGGRIGPGTAFAAFAHAAACELVRELDARGPVATLSSGCNSGADALGLALDWIRLGRADAVLVGGSEAELSGSFLAAMGAARALATQFDDRPAEASRPFDKARDGNVPGEGAAFLLVESPAAARRREVAARAALRGYACVGVGEREAYDPFNPLFKPEPMVRAMTLALEDAGIGREAISVVSANGSASVFYDVVEATAIAELLGERTADTPVHSVKSMLGQTGAVTPALQAVAATLSVQHGVVPPTINLDEVDERVKLRLVRAEALKTPVEAVLCNAIGFGGFYYSSFVIGRPRE